MTAPDHRRAPPAEPERLAALGGRRRGCCRPGGWTCSRSAAARAASGPGSPSATTTWASSPTRSPAPRPGSGSSAAGAGGEVREGDLSVVRAEETFDLVVAFEVIEHIEDDVAALAALGRAPAARRLAAAVDAGLAEAVRARGRDGRPLPALRPAGADRPAGGRRAHRRRAGALRRPAGLPAGGRPQRRRQAPARLAGGPDGGRNDGRAVRRERPDPAALDAPGPRPPRGSGPCRSASCSTPSRTPVPAWWPGPGSRRTDVGGPGRGGRASTSTTWPRSSPPRRRRTTRRPRPPAGWRPPGSPPSTRRRTGRRRRPRARPGSTSCGTARSSRGCCRPRPGRPRRTASWGRTPTRPASCSSRGRTSGRTAGGRPASRSTAARCSTPGWTVSSSWPAGWSPATAREHLVRTGPFLRIPQLAIHLDREANAGLTLDRQRHTSPVYGLGDPSPGELVGHLARLAGLDRRRRRRGTTSRRPTPRRPRGSGSTARCSPPAGWTT